MDETTIRILLYSHDSQGLGHMRRNLAIAHHLARLIPSLTGCGVSGLLVSGVPPDTRFPRPEGFDWLTIPGVMKVETGYQPRHLAEPTHSLISLRSSLLKAALLSFAPDLVVIDRHIYGVWQELRKPLCQLRAQHPDTQVVLGLREVLDTPTVATAEWRGLGSPKQLRALGDEVWIYGDSRVHDPVATGEAPPALSDRVRFTGYLANGRAVTDHTAGSIPIQEPFVLTTAGGGSDGHELLRAAAAAAVPAGHRHVIVTGPQLPENDFAAVKACAGPRTEVHRSWPGLSRHIAAASAVIAMGGYNTACEILASDTPALLVPREHPRWEQLIRARSLAAVGAVDVLRAGHANHIALGNWLAAAVTRRTDRSGIARDGLTTVARYAADLLDRFWVRQQLKGVGP